MQIIKIEAYENGGHANQTGTFSKVPDGYAVIPDGMAIPETFPFVDITVENGVVTSMTAGVVPEPEPEPEAEPTEEERLRADVDFLFVMSGFEV